MLHHVGIEVAPADLERSVELWQALGFVEVEPPASLAEFTWLERDGTQVHLMPTESPTVPSHGHTAIVAPEGTTCSLHGILSCGKIATFWALEDGTYTIA